MKNKFFKKRLFVGLAASVFIGGLSFYFSRPISLLTLNDLVQEWRDSRRSAVGSVIDDPNPWKSFNHWQCFKKSHIEFRCGKLNDTFQVPEILIYHQNRHLTFSLDYSENYNCPSFLAKWQLILRNPRKACFYAAYLPTYGEIEEKKNQSPLFLLSAIKSDLGEWRLHEDVSQEEGAEEEQITTKRYGDYEVTIYKADDLTRGGIKILQGNKLIFEESEIGTTYYWGNQFDKSLNEVDIYSGTDVNQNGVPDLVFSKWSGGAHCCHFLYIFELGKSLRKLASIDSKSNPIFLKDLNGDQVPEIEFWDGAIDDQFASFAGSPSGRVVFKYGHGSYNIAHELVIKPRPTAREVEKMIANSKVGFKQKSWELPYDLLESMMKLSYSGHLNLALGIANDSWPKNRNGLKVFKKEFVASLKESPYWSSISAELE